MSIEQETSHGGVVVRLPVAQPAQRVEQALFGIRDHDARRGGPADHSGRQLHVVRVELQSERGHRAVRVAGARRPADHGALVLPQSEVLGLRARSARERQRGQFSDVPAAGSAGPQALGQCLHGP